MKITLGQLETLLIQQKKLVVERLLSSTSSYNTNNTEGHIFTIDNIDKQKFESVGMATKFPDDVNILKKYTED